MAVETKPWTRADLARLPDDGNRYEVLDGRLLVTPQASHVHQNLAVLITVQLHAYVRAAKVAHVVAPGAVPFGDNELQPDIQVIPGPPGPERWEDAPTPLLAVEILSRSSRRFDLGAKLRAYRDRVAIPTVWLVDAERGEVHVHASGQLPRVERATLTWTAPGVASPLAVDVPALFREAGVGPSP